jgi:hypothetical protein
LIQKPSHYIKAAKFSPPDRTTVSDDDNIGQASASVFTASAEVRIADGLLRINEHGREPLAPPCGRTPSSLNCAFFGARRGGSFASSDQRYGIVWTHYASGPQSN